MRLPRFHFYEPANMRELAVILNECGEEALFLAGGTDLLVRMKYGLATPLHLISLAGLDMTEITCDESADLSIGAGASLNALSRNPLVKEKCPALAEAASLVASRQIRTMATVGGNLFQNTRCLYYNRSNEWRKAVAPCVKRGGETCHVIEKSRRCFASYQGDLAPLLISLGAKAKFFAPEGEAETALEDVFTGAGEKPFLHDGNRLLTHISVPLSPRPTFSRYRKFRIREGVDFPLAGVALSLHIQEGIIRSIRICLTGVWSSPVIVREAEEVAKGNHLEPGLIDKLADLAFNSAHPVDNLGDSAIHRRSMVRAMVKESLQEAAE